MGTFLSDNLRVVRDSHDTFTVVPLHQFHGGKIPYAQWLHKIKQGTEDVRELKSHEPNAIIEENEFHDEGISELNMESSECDKNSISEFEDDQDSLPVAHRFIAVGRATSN
jgi:hypothetical protein